GNGLEAIYRFEFGLLSDKAQLPKQSRLSYVGLAGQLGTVRLGHQWSPLYEAAFAEIDILNSLDPVFYQGDFRVSNMLFYAAPVHAGNVALISVIIDGESESEKDIDASSLGLKGRWKAFTGAFGYNRNESGDYYASETTLGYDFGGNSQLWLNYEDSDRPNGVGRVYRALGALGLGRHILRALYTDADQTGDSAIQLGWQYNFSDNSRVAVEWQALSREAGPDSELLNFALRTDFYP
ncbi:MAG: porin, partial [Pseudomonadota bacterium]|nr:porin [Pseudomonadota bacterium]